MRHPGGQRYKKNHCGQRIVHVRRTPAPGMQSGGGVVAVALSPARVCGWKRIGVTNGANRVTLWWNYEVKDDIRAKKVIYKHGFRTKPTLLCIRGTLRCGSP